MANIEIDNDDPIVQAKIYTNKLTDLVIAAKAANENTRHVVYSPKLADQIPRSYAAHAFLQLQDTLLYYSVVRACALFDKAANDRISLHTVVRAFPNKKAVRMVARETYRYHATQREPRRLTPEEDPEVQKLVTEHWKQWREELGRKEEVMVYRRVRVAKMIIERAERLLIRDHLRPFRDNFIAHNLADTARTGKEIKFVLGMEDRAIEHAKCAVDLLHLALNGTSFAWEDLEEMQRRNASEFWDNLQYQTESQ